MMWCFGRAGGGEGGGGKNRYGHGIASRESEGAVCRPRKKLKPATMRMGSRTRGLERAEEGGWGLEERGL